MNSQVFKLTEVKHIEREVVQFGWQASPQPPSMAIRSDLAA